MTARQIRRVTPVATGPALAIGLPPVEGKPPWQAFALCSEVDPEMFFPELGQPSAPAKKICAGCEVRTECLDYAMDNGELFGIWGGTSERERKAMRRRRRLGLPLEVAA
jgi:WhiB family redox-sensing transcriptional regulator